MILFLIFFGLHHCVIDPPVNQVEIEMDLIAKAEKQKAEHERQLLLAAEKARKEKEAKEAAAKKAKTDKANALPAGAFKNGGLGNPAGKGSGSGSGKGFSKGFSWNLAGRDLKSVEKPEYKGNQIGKIVVNIYVNNAGNVIAADIAQGTTISEKSLRDECIKKAMKIKFNADPKAAPKQKGAITYEFKIN